MAILVLPLVATTTNAGAAASKSDLPLVGTNWVLTSRVALGVPLRSAGVSARFAADGTLSGHTPCNYYSTTYAVDASKLLITSDIGGTDRACPSRFATAVARVYLARLPRVRTFAISGTTLTLSDLRGRRLLAYHGTGPADLVGRWTAMSYYTGTAVQSVASGSKLTADFAKSTVAGDGGCNQFNGAYIATGSSIEIGPLASTRRACSDEALSTQEQQYFAALELATSFRITGRKLELLREHETIAATFFR